MCGDVGDKHKCLFFFVCFFLVVGDECRPAVHDRFQKTALDPLWCFLMASDIK